MSPTAVMHQTDKENLRKLNIVNDNIKCQRIFKNTVTYKTKKLASQKCNSSHFFKTHCVNKDRTTKTFEAILKQLTFADNCSQINTVFYKCTGEIPGLQTKDQATEVISRANDCVIKVRSSNVRTSGVIQQQSINKDVSSARQVPDNTSL